MVLQVRGSPGSLESHPVKVSWQPLEQPFQSGAGLLTSDPDSYREENRRIPLGS